MDLYEAVVSIRLRVRCDDVEEAVKEDFGSEVATSYGIWSYVDHQVEKITPTTEGVASGLEGIYLILDAIDRKPLSPEDLYENPPLDMALSVVKEVTQFLLDNNVLKLEGNKLVRA